MLAATVRPRSSPFAMPRLDARATVVLLACATLLLRLPDIGNPVIDLDEQMYLLVGDRMWSGALPYVDIWDRKPVGLFLIYALARWPGGDPFVGYQLLAAACALATAGVVAAMARRLATPAAGLAAGLVYLAWIALIGGRGGQAPVFYNLPMALAAWATWRAATGEPAGRRRLELTAMLLAGVALQIKPTAVFEGGFLGLALLAGRWRQGGPRRALLGDAALFAAVALVPTLLAFGGYAALGHADAWWFANVESIFRRVVTPNEPVGERLAGLGVVLAAPAVAALAGIARLPRRDRPLPLGWLAAATLGVLAIPPYYNHYALPLVVPLAVCAGIGIAASRPVALAVALAGALLLTAAGLPDWRATADARARVATMTATIERHRHGGCIFVFQAPPVFYQTTRSCLLTRYPFGPHLTFAGESRAIGVDAVAEVRRILTQRPPVIVSTAPRGDVNRATFALVETALSRDYTRVGGDLGYDIYARRRGARITPRPAHNP